MKKKKFRMKTKPAKPKRNKITETLDLEYTKGTMIKSWLISMEEYGVSLDEIYGDTDYEASYGSCCDEKHVYLVCKRDETDEELKVRMDKYEKNLKDYNVWYKENEENIKQRLAEKEEAARKEKEREAAQLEKEIKKLNKELKKLKTDK